MNNLLGVHFTPAAQPPTSQKVKKLAKLQCCARGGQPSLHFQLQQHWMLCSNAWLQKCMNEAFDIATDPCNLIIVTLFHIYESPHLTLLLILTFSYNQTIMRPGNNLGLYFTASFPLGIQKRQENTYTREIFEQRISNRLRMKNWSN